MYYTCHLSHLLTKPTKWLCAQQPPSPIAAQSDQSSLCTQWVTKEPSFKLQAFFMQQWRLIRLGRCPGWSESSLGAMPFCWFSHEAAHLISKIHKKTSKVTTQISLCIWEIWSVFAVTWSLVVVMEFNVPLATRSWQWDLGLVSSERLEEWRIEPATLGLQGQHSNHWTLAAPHEALVHWIPYEPLHEKTCLCYMWTTKAQISLRIRAVWSAPLLFAA